MRRPGGSGVAVVLTSALVASVAWADDTITFRGNYYREPSTRVVEPTVTLSKDVGAGNVAAYYLLDAITSASVGAGAATDEPFTELRNEAGVQLTNSWSTPALLLRGRLGYRFSHEPDYTAQFVGLGAEAELNDRNTVMSLGYSAGFDDVRRRLANSVVDAGTLRTHFISAAVTQLLSRRWLAAVGYDVALLDGFLQSPYRSVSVGGGAPLRETHPDARMRHALSARSSYRPARWPASLHGVYRYYRDDWGVRGHTLESRAHVDLPAGVAAKLTYRYYRQGAADFYQTFYASLPANALFTADPKLSAFDSHYGEAELRYGLDRLAQWQPLAWLRDSSVSLSYGYLVQFNRFGNAHLAQAGWTLPY
jgi:hypothetical protein